MLKQTLIITSAVLATALILSGVSVADDNTARGHGLVTAQEAAKTHGMQGRCNAASHQNITLNGCGEDPLPPPPPTTEPLPIPPPTTEPPPPPTTEPPPPNGL
jgi:hypothetical protein